MIRDRVTRQDRETPRQPSAHAGEQGGRSRPSRLLSTTLLPDSGGSVSTVFRPFGFANRPLMPAVPMSRAYKKAKTVNEETS